MEKIAEMEIEADPAIGVDVGQGTPERSHLDLDPDLLEHLPPQALHDALPSMAFPARKFPAPSLVIAALPPCDEHFGAVPEDSSRNFVKAHEAQFALLGWEASFSSRFRKASVRAHASLAAAARYPPQGLLTFAKACPAPG